MIKIKTVKIGNGEYYILTKNNGSSIRLSKKELLTLYDMIKELLGKKKSRKYTITYKPFVKTFRTEVCFEKREEALEALNRIVEKLYSKARLRGNCIVIWKYVLEHEIKKILGGM